ncbi:SgrR family transcriptional regulator [Macrococcoides caseolyticum]|uniref:SgrR family transcriptional regulator n=1 Tax=Macrococcoides caseolyticum TaxID=69966 RepID=UPI001F177DB8|nr:SgrR family transcriptional regulator [Macrococcus caseolyticus]MCE4957892.1 SgrR family transcriptional regulator [Macrococcus caseolyticus]
MSVDDKLLRLYIFMKNNSFSREAVSDFLEISSRQLSRLLNKWSEDGFIAFNSGVGRGNATQVDFLKNIEAEYINEVIHGLENYNIIELQKMMSLDMSESSKRILRLCIEEVLFRRRDFSVKHSKYVDYLYRIPEVIHPLEYLDIALATVLENVGERLYIMDDNNIVNHLVAYDEWIGNDLIIHIHRDVHFSNGELLFADNIVQVLLNLVKKYRDFPGFNDIINIEVLAIFKFKITMSRPTDLIKLMLSQPFATIYKSKGKNIYYTGPYMIYFTSPEVIKLRINPYFTENIPDLTDIWLVKDADYYHDFVRNNDLRADDLKDSYSINFLLFHPNYQLPVSERKRLEEIIHTEAMTDAFIDDMKLLIIKSSRSRIEETLEKISKCVKVFEIVEVTVEEYVKKNLNEFDVDAVVMNEFLDMDRRYFELLLSNKFSDWMKDYQESKNLNYIYRNKSVDYWPYAEYNYEQFLLKNGLMINIAYYKKMLPKVESFKEYELSAYGIPKYNTIISVEEGNL